MTLRLYDTVTRAPRDFVPLTPGHASVYLCGATVQGEPHIGHVRSGVAFDVLRRWLLAHDYDVAFVRNVTDIDDKILNKAAEAGRPWWEWPRRSSVRSTGPTGSWVCCRRRWSRGRPGTSPRWSR